MNSIDGTTKICAVIGDPVEHSLSPVMHNAAFKALNLNFAYVAFHVKNVRLALEGMIGLNIKGLSVTIPHKLTVMDYLDEISPLAEKIGAVNTITNEDGKLIGTNTDGFGTLRAIESLEKIDGKNVVILGVGGAARAAAFTIACERKPNKLFLLGRNEQKTSRLALEVSNHAGYQIIAGSIDYEEMRKLFRDVDIIIHTTPVGMYPNIDESLLSEELFSERHIVFDMIYNPKETLLLKNARHRFARTINGVPMFVHQGAEQFKRWTGQDAPVDVMQQAVEKVLGYE